jgi:hypothetical protein
VSFSDNSANLIFATHSTDTLDIEGNTISGAGRIGGGAAMGLINRGVIDATGENALVIDVATGKVTNGAAGLLEGSGAAGLDLDGGTFSNIGTVEAMNGSTVTFGSGAVLTNDAGGTLTGGAWRVTDTGAGASVTLAGAAITTLAATVVLTGTNASFEAGGQSLEADLTTIAAKGKLYLVADRGWTGTTTLTDSGLLQLAGGTVAETALTVAAGGTVSGTGSIAAPVENDGLIKAGRGALGLTGALTGAGTAEILSQSSLQIGGAVASPQTVLFAAGIHAVLKLGDPADFAGTLKNWALGDTIDLASTNATSAQITGDTLAIDIQGGGTLDYKLANPPSGVRIILSSDGAAGMNLTLYKALAPAAAVLAQHMAAMAPAPSASASVATAAPGAAALGMAIIGHRS